MTKVLVQHRAWWGGPGKKAEYDIPGAQYGAIQDGWLCIGTDGDRCIAQVPRVWSWRLLHEEPQLYAVRLVDLGERKIATIKALRTAHGTEEGTGGSRCKLGLKEAKDLVEQPPGSYLVRHWPQRRAELLAEDLAAAGCSVEVVPDYPEEPTP